ncbi:MAG: DUF167 domain-containing protein [Polyangiales bacterium]|nr:DUF167 domain-containing protein [Myxococcales bacterium]
MVDEFQVRAFEGGVGFDVQVAPRASRTAALGIHAGALKIALAAPPVDGEANAALVEFFAKALGVPKRDVRIVRGATSKRKHVEVLGVTAADVLSACT